MLYFLIILLEDNRGIITQSHSSRGKRGNRGMRTRAELVALLKVDTVYRGVRQVHGNDNGNEEEKGEAQIVPMGKTKLLT